MGRSDDGSDDDSMGGMTFHDRLEFWGVEVAPGKRVDIAFDDGDEELVHITQARARTEGPSVAAQRARVVLFCVRAGRRRRQRSVTVA
jgi:hypothetical protein